MSEKKQRIVVVTGGGSGIGKAVATLFATKGDYVYTMFRKATDGNITKIGEGVIEERVCDVTDESSIDKAFAGIDKIDVLIHSAGCGIGGSAELTSNADAHFQFETNYFGTLNVNRRAISVMRKAGCGLVIITSSVGGVFALPFQGHYSASKFALEGYAGALRNELHPFGVKVVVIEPGDAHTSFTSSRRITEPESSPYKEMCEHSMEKAASDEKNGYSAERVAATYYKVSRKKHPYTSYAVGLSYKTLVFIKRFCGGRFISFVLRKMYM